MFSRSLVAALLLSITGTAVAQPSASPPQEPAPAVQEQPEPLPPPRATIIRAARPTRRVDVGRNQRLLGLEIGGAGLLAIAVGAIAGFDARSKRDDARALGCSEDLSLCPPGDALDRAEQAYSRGRFATGFFIGGAIAIGAGAALWLTAPRGTPRRWRATPTVGNAGAGVVLGRGF